MDQHRITLEICTASIEDAMIAASAGADRIELNTALPLGGLTPTPGMVRAVVRELNIPVIAMCRPRESGFLYSAREFGSMLDDVDWLLEAGVAGIAFGVLDNQAGIDAERCRQVVQRISGRCQTVFHRAFDLVTDPGAALERLVDCGVNRIMTSGCRPTARQGQSLIRQLVEQSRDRIEVLAAGSIRSDHVAELIRETRVTQVHAGLGRPAIDPSGNTGNGVSFYSALPENPAQFRQSCPEKIREMRDLLG